MSPASKKHAGGRPRVKVTPAQVKQLREGAKSWRQIARALGIGTATAMRLYEASGSKNASHNSSGATG